MGTSSIKNRVLIPFLYMLFGYGWVSVNIVMPILPQLSRYFHSLFSQTVFSVTAFLIGFSFFQVVWGHLSDSIGRRKALIIGCSLTVTGALAAAFSFSMPMFIVARLFEGVGTASVPVIARSIMMDVFDRPTMVKVIAISAIIVATVPALSALVGGWLSALAGWRAVLVFLALYAFVIICLISTKIPETHLPEKAEIKLITIFNAYWECFSHKQFVASLILYGFFFGGMLGFYTDAPFLFIECLHFSKKTYGWFMLAPVIAYITGVYLAKEILKKQEPNFTIRLSLVLCVVSIISIIAFLFATLSVVSIILPMTLFVFAAGIISPSVNTIAMTAFQKNKGVVAALIGSSMALGSALLTSLVALFHTPNLFPLLCMVSFIAVFSVIIYHKMLSEKRLAAAVGS